MILPLFDGSTSERRVLIRVSQLTGAHVIFEDSIVPPQFTNIFAQSEFRIEVHASEEGASSCHRSNYGQSPCELIFQVSNRQGV